MSMLIYTYPQKSLRKIKVDFCNHQADGPFMCHLLSELVICEWKEYDAVFDTE